MDKDSSKPIKGCLVIGGPLDAGLYASPSIKRLKLVSISL